jgi:hypothetical protein
VLVYGAFGGRLDHEMANLGVLLSTDTAVLPLASRAATLSPLEDAGSGGAVAASAHPGVAVGAEAAALPPAVVPGAAAATPTCFRQLVLLSAATYAVALPAGDTVLAVHPPWEGRHVGLLPLSGPITSLTTRGLQWDVAGWRTWIGGPLSTSNRLAWFDAHPAGGSAVDAAGVVEVTIRTSAPLVWTSDVDLRALMAAT